MKQLIATLTLTAALMFTASGQTPSGAPEFEVASVKPSTAHQGHPMPMMSGAIAEMMGFNGGPGTEDPGRIDYSGVSLKMLLVRAYGVRPYQISGPGWLDNERYDIVAKVPPGT